MAQQVRMRCSSVEMQSGPVATSCYPDTLQGPYSASFDQIPDTLSLLLAASASAQHGLAQNGIAQNGLGSNGFVHDGGLAGLANKQMPFLPGQGVSQPVTPDNFDPSLMECEEPGPLPCLPRTRALGSGGPYGSSSAALMMQQQQQHAGGYPQGASGRQGRPRRHSVTIGMLNEHQQQQQAAAYAAALAAAQQGSMEAAGLPCGPQGPGMGLGMMGQIPQPPQQQPGAAASPTKQQLQAFNNVHAMAAAAAAAQLGLGAGSLLAGLGLQADQQLQQQLAASSAMPMGAGDLGEYGAQFSMNAPRMPNAGGCRRHSWAPMGVNGSTAYAQALLLQQQQQQQQQRQFAAAAGLGNPRGLMGVNGLNGMNGMNGLNGVNGVNGMGVNKQKPLGPRLPAGYTNGSTPYLNGHTPNGSGPASGGYAAAAAAAALAQLTSLQSAGALAGMDPVLEQQLTRLLQLQQQSGLAGQPMLDPYMEAVLEAGQALGQPNPALLPSLAPLAGAVLPPATAGLLPAAVAAATQLTQLGFDVDGLSPVAAAAAASMYAPLKINGVTLDSQLLVAPFADNWDVMCAQGQAGVTPQQLAAMAGTLNAGHVGYGVNGVKSPRSNGVRDNMLGAQGASSLHSKHHKALPTRSGSSGSNSSNGSNGHLSGSAPLSNQPLGHINGKNGTTAAAANGNNSSSTAAALAAASISAAVPPIANVCSDAPWDLKKAAEEDAKVLAAQQGRVEKLVTLLERSQTLAKVRAAQAAANPDASDAASSNSKSAAERAQPVLFGYQLPDTGADAWGGSSSSAALDSAPGSGCISQEPSNKLFVGNIGWWVTEDDLLHWFSRFGNVVHVKIMYNSRKMHKPKDKWRSREYGFIDYATPEEAAKAIVWMDGVELPDLMKDTCGIIVQYAKPTGGSGNGSSSRTGSGEAVAVV